MIGRPALFALGAEGAGGLNALLNCFVADITVVMAQLGIRAIDQLGPDVIFKDRADAHGEPDSRTQAALQRAART